MSGHDGQLQMRQFAVDQMQVGAAHAAGLHPQPHLTGLRFGIGTLPEYQRVAYRFERHGAHGWASMTEQHGQPGIPEHVPGGAAQRPFAETTAAVGTHDEQVGVEAVGVFQQRLADLIPGIDEIL